MRKTPLYAAHQALGAKWVDFAGWAMPLYYQRQSLEHLAVRQAMGVFDVSHMGIIELAGKEASVFLSQVLANDVAKIAQAGKALYSCMLNPRGGIIDDLIVYHWAPQQYGLVVNAARTAVDWDWLQQQAQPYALQLQQRSDLALLALQGQAARQCLSDLCKDSSIKALRPFCLMQSGDYRIAATGYTGEDGFEIMLPAEQAPAFWDRLMAAGVTPIGLAARDSLRLEAGLNLYGLDMDETVSPFESHLGWTVSLSTDRAFIGKAALMAQQRQGISRQLQAVKLLGKGLLRAGQALFDATGAVLGHITSASYSPLLEQAIGFARLVADAPANAWVDIRGTRLPIACLKPPLWRKTYSVIYAD